MRRPRNIVQNTFEGGEADPAFERRADADLWQLTAKRMRNVRLLYGGGFARRPGLARVLNLGETARLIPFVSRAGTKRLLAFRDDEVDVIKPDETIEDTLLTTGILAAYIGTMQWTQYDDRIIIAHQSLAPQEFVWDEAGLTFTQQAFPFETRNDTSRGWPYYRFRDTRNVTITPSARTGVGITLQASGDVFQSTHVGQRFQLIGREVEVTAFTDANTVTATVKQELYPTRRLTVGSSTGFFAGQIVQDQVGDIQMEVASIVSGTQIDVILIDTFTDPSTTSNNLIGPNGTTTLTAVGAPGAEGGTIQWTEELMSDVRGYPGGVLAHKDRLIFYDFLEAPELHAMSVLGTIEDFDTGDGLDDEAIIDGPGDAKGRRVRWCISSEQLISLTEVGSYYVGEGPSTPLTPGNVEFLQIGPEGAGTCNPVKTAEGVIFAEEASDRLMLLAPTGQLRRAWSATEMLAMASELFNTPSRMLLVDGSDLGPERYLMAVNADGTLCCVHYRRDSEVAGTSLWSTSGGTFVDVALFDGSVYAVVNRSGTYTLERFDNDRLLDCSILISNTSPNTPTSSILAGRANVALVWRKTAGGEDRRVELGTLYTGSGGGVGALTGAPTATRDYEAGTRIDVLATPWPPVDPMFGPIEHQRIKRASIDILNSGMFYAMGQKFTAYTSFDDPSEPPPLRTGWRRRKYLGRKRDFDFEVTQVEAAPLTVRVITLETS